MIKAKTFLLIAYLQYKQGINSRSLNDRASRICEADVEALGLDWVPLVSRPGVSYPICIRWSLSIWVLLVWYLTHSHTFYILKFSNIISSSTCIATSCSTLADIFPNSLEMVFNSHWKPKKLQHPLCSHYYSKKPKLQQSYLLCLFDAKNNNTRNTALHWRNWTQTSLDAFHADEHKRRRWRQGAAAPQIG